MTRGVMVAFTDPRPVCAVLGFAAGSLHDATLSALLLVALVVFATWAALIADRAAALELDDERQTAAHWRAEALQAQHDAWQAEQRAEALERTEGDGAALAHARPARIIVPRASLDRDGYGRDDDDESDGGP